MLDTPVAIRSLGLENERQQTVDLNESTVDNFDEIKLKLYLKLKDTETNLDKFQQFSPKNFPSSESIPYYLSPLVESNSNIDKDDVFDEFGIFKKASYGKFKTQDRVNLFTSTTKEALSPGIKSVSNTKNDTLTVSKKSSDGKETSSKPHSAAKSSSEAIHRPSLGGDIPESMPKLIPDFIAIPPHVEPDSNIEDDEDFENSKNSKFVKMAQKLLIVGRMGNFTKKIRLRTGTGYNKMSTL